MKGTAPLTTRLVDPTAERVRANHEQRLLEIGALPVNDLRAIPGVSFPDNVGVQVPHGLGRAPKGYWIGPPAGAASAGVIGDFGATTPAGNPNDLTQTLSLRANGFGATVTATVFVF